MALCTIDEVKDYAGITGSQSEINNLIEAIVDRVQSNFESYCGRKFESQEHTEYLDGYGGQLLFTEQYPVTSVSGIWESSSRTWDDVSAVDSDDYFISSNRTILRKSGYYINYPKAIKIIYTAGYSTIPADLKQACISEVARHLNIRRTPEVSSKVYDDVNTNYITSDFLPTTKAVLSNYRKMDIS